MVLGSNPIQRIRGLSLPSAAARSAQTSSYLVKLDSSDLDSSLLTSLYAPDAHSAAARESLPQATGPLLLTPFGEAELRNAILLRVFRREITAAQAQAALERLAAHIANGVF